MCLFIFLVWLFLSARGELSSGTVHQKCCQQILNQRRGGSVLFIRQEGKHSCKVMQWIWLVLWTFQPVAAVVFLVGFPNFSANQEPAIVRLKLSGIFLVVSKTSQANQRNQQLHNANITHVFPACQTNWLFWVAKQWKTNVNHLQNGFHFMKIENNQRSKRKLARFQTVVNSSYGLIPFNTGIFCSG